MMRGMALAAIIVIALTGSAAGQDRQLGRFRVLLHSGQLFEGYDGILTAASLVGRNQEGRRVQVDRSELRSLEIFERTEARKWAIVGAAIASAALGLTIAQGAADPDLQLRSTGRVVAASTGFIAGGAVIGGVLGARQERWRPIAVERVTSSLLGWPGHARVAGAVSVSF